MMTINRLMAKNTATRSQIRGNEREWILSEHYFICHARNSDTNHRGLWILVSLIKI